MSEGKIRGRKVMQNLHKIPDITRIRHSVIHNDIPDIRGMIAKVRELVKVEEITD